MKKKIILFLTFLVIVMCLTGCSQKHVIQGEKLEEITQIANNVVTQKAYELPEGYAVSFPDSTTNARIKIRDNGKWPTEYLDVIFDISTEKIKIVEISVSSGIPACILMIIMYGGGILVVVYLLISGINKSIKKSKRLNKESRH